MRGVAVDILDASLAVEGTAPETLFTNFKTSRTEVKVDATVTAETEAAKPEEEVIAEKEAVREVQDKQAEVVTAMCQEIKQGKPIVGVTTDVVAKEVTAFIKDAAEAGNPEATHAFADLQSAISGQILSECGCNAVSKTLEDSLVQSYPLTGAADVADEYSVEHLGVKITTTFSEELKTSIGDWTAKNAGDTVLYTTTNIKTNLLQSSVATEINAGPATSGNFLSCKTGL